MKRLYMSIPLFIGLMASIGACSNGSGAADAQAGLSRDSLPPMVNRLIEAVSSSDSVAFASMVSYPLERPYPLRSITSPESMRAYYRVMVDDSLRNVITGGHGWGEYGWRGWTVDDGQYLWVDDSVYSVDYLSPREQQMRQALVQREMRSLAPSLRGVWEPVGCLKSADGEVMRIDMQQSSDNEAPLYRLAIYGSQSEMRGEPMALFTGYKEVEGTAALASYYFTGPSGMSAVYLADQPGDGTPSVTFTLADGRDRTVPVIPGYWLDLLP